MTRTFFRTAFSFQVISILIFILLITQKISAQNSLNTFAHLSRPEKWWVLIHPFKIHKAKYCVNEARMATQEMKTDTTLDGDADGGQVDAFRHSYWMALLSQRMRWQKALSLGRAHEKGNYLQFKHHKNESEGSLPDSVAGAMDLFNNKIGCQIGRENRTVDNNCIKTLTKTAILQGKMEIISKDSQGRYLDCLVRPINLNEYKNLWAIPKCIITSDAHHNQ